MKIKNIQTALYRIPLPTVLSDSTHGEISHFELITVRISAGNGAEGVGYTYTVGSGGAAVCCLVERDIKTALLGLDPRRIEEIWETMWWKLHYVGRGGITVFAISAVDIALWDMKARCEAEPLWRFLGGHSDRVKAYAGGIDLHFSIEQLKEQTKENLKKGFLAIKMKVGRDDLKEDIARVEAIRQFVGPDITLMVDANMRWSVDTAIRAARALEPYDIYWLEEPTIPDDVKGHARIAREGGLPIATGENLHTIYEFQSMMEQGYISFPEPDVSNIGGISGWMRVAKLAYANNLPVTSHGAHDLHVHLLAAVPNASYLEAHGFGIERFIAHPLEIKNGEAIAPNRPGHGVEFLWDKMEEHRIQ
ncbi:MAG: mandelate racemase/muconate lactonizing enzyme family protein [Deltaproteobacteria bacterium]|nr:mandelate racemase/muconate lactonizing enzyme family protein [Deltaproteobacteria bacterium]MBW1994081.1 mandelate racemase/muconate lactonizing enzyme family protein [Deltaproteobacteria bacterium]